MFQTFFNELFICLVNIAFCVKLMKNFNNKLNIVYKFSALNFIKILGIKRKG